VSCVWFGCSATVQMATRFEKPPSSATSIVYVMAPTGPDRAASVNEKAGVSDVLIALAPGARLDVRTASAARGGQAAVASGARLPAAGE